MACEMGPDQNIGGHLAEFGIHQQESTRIQTNHQDLLNPEANNGDSRAALYTVLRQKHQLHCSSRPSVVPLTNKPNSYMPLEPSAPNLSATRRNGTDQQPPWLANPAHSSHTPHAMLDEGNHAERSYRPLEYHSTLGVMS